jgi:hypothetical protein
VSAACQTPNGFGAVQSCGVPKGIEANYERLLTRRRGCIIMSVNPSQQSAERYNIRYLKIIQRNLKYSYILSKNAAIWYATIYDLHMILVYNKVLFVSNDKGHRVGSKLVSHATFESCQVTTISDRNAFMKESCAPCTTKSTFFMANNNGRPQCTTHFHMH